VPIIHALREALAFVNYIVDDVVNGHNGVLVERATESQVLHAGNIHLHKLIDCHFPKNVPT
jgi:ABC-type antimicrobial peptide transport system ATPase subunit